MGSSAEPRAQRAAAGVVSFLVSFNSVPGLIADYGRPLSTATDLRDRAETVILAPEKRKVGGSIPPLTTR